MNASPVSGFRRVGAFLAACIAAAALLPAHAQKAGANPIVEMTVEKRGALTIELFQKDAPKTVAHFVGLVNKKFYDGILFHRVEPHFVVQAGDPASKKVDGAKIAGLSSQDAGEQYHLGMGGSGKTVPLEANVPHTRGTLGLARSQASDSGDSQFFLNLIDNHGLDAQYCVFGKVIKGTEVMDAIRQGDRIKSIRVIGGMAGRSKPRK